MTTPTPARDSRVERAVREGMNHTLAQNWIYVLENDCGLVVSDPDYLRAAISDAYTYHHRTSINGCPCGWNELGASHSDHVADVVLDSLRGAQ